MTRRELALAIAHQQRWIEEHGGDEAGYLARYGSLRSASDKPVYGDGGEAIWKADSGELNALITRWEIEFGANADHDCGKQEWCPEFGWAFAASEAFARQEMQDRVLRLAQSVAIRATVLGQADNLASLDMLELSQVKSVLESADRSLEF